MEEGKSLVRVPQKKTVSLPSNQEKLLFWKSRIINLAKILVDHTQRFGFCVIDNFLGANLCSLVFKDVTSQNTTMESPGIKHFLMIMDCLMKQSSRTGLIYLVVGKQGDMLGLIIQDLEKSPLFNL
eukprot:TRINITY_DN4241_c0_g1_i1.p1 TRINITY_DN4241_c0_g1~~TRINITY_DN4241_c0_g1_i1.p1  ORF type:complete len:126 (-),score=25.21 TRINITY_DN4241_c0_g1_i1:49-426(-)